MKRPSVQRGFTLVEMIVAVGLLSIVLLLIASMTNSTASVWRFTSGKIEQFRNASNAFDAMTRRLSLATLNTYWDYNSTTAPTAYLRQSELRFISGVAQGSNGAIFITGTTVRPTHAIFFQAPLGFVDESPLVNNPNFGGLDNLLNTWGYYVEYNQDVRPSFLNPNSPNHIPNPPPVRNRFRLMELMQPSNEMKIYNYTSGPVITSAGTANPSYTRNLFYITNPPLYGLTPLIAPSGVQPFVSYNGREWFMDAMNEVQPPVHVLAENVIALILLPKLTQQDEMTLTPQPAVSGTALAPNYNYDSTTTNTVAMLNPQNQLPPVVQVTMVAIDEVSAKRMSLTAVANLNTEVAGLFSNAGSYGADLSSLQSYLVANKINYRTFTSDVAIRGAKWSTN